MKDITVKFENDVIIESNADNTSLFEKLEDFALRNNQVMTVCFEKGQKVVMANDYAGLLRLNDGTQIEIYPRLCTNPATARMLFGRLVSAYLDIPFEKNIAVLLNSENISFIEYFTAVFVREVTKIMKSGMLMGYTSIEENTNSMQGSILFSENIRRNLAHRERMYVRHDVFTPDRAENRLIKAAAQLLSKLTQNHKNEQELKKILIFLDEVKQSDSCERDFANCVNTRNAKKYTAVLNICRMLLSRQNSGFSGKYASCAIFFPMQELFAAYIARLAKSECRDGIVKTMAKSGFICDENRLFTVSPHIDIREKNGDIRCIANARWSHITNINEINSEDIFRLIAYAGKMKCKRVTLIYPSYGAIPDTTLSLDCGEKIALTIKFADFSDGSAVSEFSLEPAEIEDIEDSEEILKAEEIDSIAEDMLFPEETEKTEVDSVKATPEKSTDNKAEKNVKTENVKAEKEKEIPRKAEKTKKAPEKKRLQILKRTKK